MPETTYFEQNRAITRGEVFKKICRSEIGKSKVVKNPVRTFVRVSRYLFYLKKGPLFFKMGSRFAKRTYHKKSQNIQKWYLFYQNGTSKRDLSFFKFLDYKA